MLSVAETSAPMATVLPVAEPTSPVAADPAPNPPVTLTTVLALAVVGETKKSRTATTPSGITFGLTPMARQVNEPPEPPQFTVSLGIFKTEEAAANYLAQLAQKGVRSAVSRPRGAKTTIFVIRDPGDAIAAKIAGLKTEFPATTLKAGACTDAQQSAKSQ